MLGGIQKISKLCESLDQINISEISVLFQNLIRKLTNKVDNYLGDYPTFIEPVYLETNVKIGDDVLLGPNVYIGANSSIGDYVEISNSIILDNASIGENFKLENCIIAKDSKFNFNNLNIKNAILIGSASSKNELTIKRM
jgi:NDP-sugar pyrophosphorylase family protein